MIDRRIIVRSAAWRTAEVIAGEGLSFVIFLILARMLAPESFGVMALAAIAVHLARELVNSGLPDLAIKGDELGNDRYATLFLLNVAAGVALAIGLVVMVPVLLLIVDDPRIPLLMALLALSLPFAAVAGIFAARLRRNLEMRSFAVRAIFANIAGAAVAIPMAAGGFDVYALVAQQMVTSLASVAVFAWALGSDAWPCGRWCASTAREGWHVGRRIAIGTFIRFAGRRLDLVALGVVAPVTVVGQYFVAQRIIYALHMVTTFSIEQIALPALARRRGQGFVFAEEAAAALRWSALTSWPLVAVVALISGPLVHLAFGETWSEAALPLAGLCVGAGSLTIIAVGGQILLLLDRADWQFRISMASGGIQIAAAAAGALIGGATGAAWIIAVTQVPIAFTCIMMVARFAGTSFFSMAWMAFRIPVVACGAVALATCAGLALASMPAAAASPMMTLLAGGSAGVAAFTVVFAIIFLPQIQARLQTSDARDEPNLEGIQQ